MDLSQYILDTQALMRDSNFLLTSQAQLIRWINQARYDICLKTGAIEVLVAGNCPAGTSCVPGFAQPNACQPGNNLAQSFQTIAGVEKYPYAYANNFIKYNNTGVKGIIEVKQVAVSWGSFRPVCRWMPWQDLQAYCRSWNVGVYNFPLIWSDTGDGERGEVWLWTPPSISGVSSVTQTQGEMEWLCSCVPLNLNTANDYEAIPEPYQRAVKFGAAKYCMLGANRYGSAQIYSDMMSDSLGIARVSVDRGKVNDPYYTW